MTEVATSPKAAPTTTPLLEAPLLDRVIVRRDEKYTKVEGGDAKTAGGLFIPSSVQQESLCTGTVVAVGPGKRDMHGNMIPMVLQCGDRVRIGKFSGTDLDDARTLVLISESDCLTRLIG